MIKNYIKVALRNLRNNKAFASLNIVGLAIGMATAILIGLWVMDELNFDHYNPNHTSLAQVLLTQTDKGESYTGSTIAMPLGYALQSKYKDLFKKVALVSFHNGHVLSIGEKKISARGIYAQPAFPDIFGLDIVKGDASLLSDPSTLMIANSLAVSLFGNEDPINKIVRLNDKYNMKVGAVYADLPENSSYVGTDLLLPWGNADNSYLSQNTNWGDHNG
jgi:putative ABC transport system permease protein